MHAGEQRRGVAELATWVATSSSSVSAPSSGVSPGRMTMVGVVVVVVAVERGHADRRCVAGAVLLDLLGEGDVRPAGCHRLHLLGDLLGTVADDDGGAVGCSFSSAWMTWSTIGRPQMRWSGLGRSDRIRVPAPAARTIAETLIGRRAERRMVGRRAATCHRSGERNRTPIDGTKNRCPTIKRPRMVTDRACRPGPSR